MVYSILFIGFSKSLVMSFKLTFKLTLLYFNIQTDFLSFIFLLSLKRGLSILFSIQVLGWECQVLYVRRTIESDIFFCGKIHGNLKTNR